MYIKYQGQRNEIQCLSKYLEKRKLTQPYIALRIKNKKKRSRTKLTSCKLKKTKMIYFFIIIFLYRIIFFIFILFIIFIIIYYILYYIII